MIFKKVNYLAFLTTTFLSSTSFAGDINANLNTTAQIESFCQINAADINFGVVNLPLTAQTANSQMNVMCSNATAYKVDLSYGGIYGSGGGNDGVNYTFVKNSGFPGVQIWYAYADGKHIGRFNCYSNQEIYLHTDATAIANKLGLEVSKTYYDNGKYGLCSGTSVHYGLASKLSQVSAYNYGIMKGTMKGDKLAYAITIPNDSTKVWNKGINSYSLIGTGINQVIEMNAKIIVDQSSSKYIAADTYLDTITANVSY